MYRFVGHSLQAMGAHAFIIGYPKFPKRKFPSFIEDAQQALIQIKTRYPSRRVVLLGHSAGAHTALLLGLSKTKLADRVVSISGVCTLSPKWKPVFGDALDNGLSDPRTYVKTANKDTSFLLIHGYLDYIVAFSDSVSLNRLLAKDGIKSRLILILIDHSLILPFLFIGPLYFTR